VQPQRTGGHIEEQALQISKTSRRALRLQLRQTASFKRQTFIRSASDSQRWFACGTRILRVRLTSGTPVPLP